jgi:MFS family permease
MRQRTACFWAASAFSSASTWVMQVSLFVFVLQQRSAATLSVVEFAGTVPLLFCLPFTGALADRGDPRIPAFLSLLLQTPCVVMMAVFLHGSVALLTVAYALQGIAGCLWAPSRQQWLYGVIPAEGRTRANAALSTVSGTMTIIGATLGGVLSAWNPQAALLVAAGLQALSVLPLAFLVRADLTPHPGARHSFRADLAEGFTAVRHLPLARSVIGVGIAWGLIGGGYDILLAAYAVQVAHAGGGALGGLYIVDGLGVLIGAALATRAASRHHLPLYASSYVAQGVFWSALFLAPSILLGGTLLAGMRIASGVIIALDTTILLATVPGRLRGRVTSLHITTYNATSRLSLAVFGGLLAALGTATVGVATGAASAILGALWWISRRKAGETPASAVN